MRRRTLSGEEGNERVTPKTVTLRLWLDSRSEGHVIRWRCVWTIMGFCVAVKLYGSSSTFFTPCIYRGIRGNMGTWGIWAKLNINVEIVVANFVFSQIAVGTI